MSRNASGTGSQVWTSTTWMASVILMPASPPVMSFRISSPRTSSSQVSLLRPHLHGEISQNFLTWEDLHSGPWSTAGMSMQAPASANSSPGSMSKVTSRSTWWSIFETEM